MNYIAKISIQDHGDPFMRSSDFYLDSEGTYVRNKDNAYLFTKEEADKIIFNLDTQSVSYCCNNNQYTMDFSEEWYDSIESLVILQENKKREE